MVVCHRFVGEQTADGAAGRLPAECTHVMRMHIRLRRRGRTPSARGSSGSHSAGGCSVRRDPWCGGRAARRPAEGGMRLSASVWGPLSLGALPTPPRLAQVWQSTQCRRRRRNRKVFCMETCAPASPSANPTTGSRRYASCWCAGGALGRSPPAPPGLRPTHTHDRLRDLWDRARLGQVWRRRRVSGTSGSSSRRPLMGAWTTTTGNICGRCWPLGQSPRSPSAAILIVRETWSSAGAVPMRPAAEAVRTASWTVLGHLLSIVLFDRTH